MLDLIVIFIIIIIVIMTKIRASIAADLDDLRSIAWVSPKPAPQPTITEPAVEPTVEATVETAVEPKAKRTVSFSPRIEVLTFNKNNGEIVDRYSRGI